MELRKYTVVVKDGANRRIIIAKEFCIELTATRKILKIKFQDERDENRLFILPADYGKILQDLYYSNLCNRASYAYCSESVMNILPWEQAIEFKCGGILHREASDRVIWP